MAQSVVAAENTTMARRMNDPHVDALIFRVEHGPSVAYADDAPPITWDEGGFRVVLEDGTARFELKEHHATEEEALERVRPYIRSWELGAGLRGRPGDFRLEFQEAEVIDRDPPPPGSGAVKFSFAVSTPSVTLTLARRSYPPPPMGIPLKADDPDVATMYDRLDGYYSAREPLPGMAYFCLTVLQRFDDGRRTRADTAAHYYIDVAVLHTIGKLSSTKGGAGSARKAVVPSTPLSPNESRFLEEAVKTIIRRAAEVAADPGGAFPTITLADLPDRS